MNNHDMFFAVVFIALVILLLIAGMYIVIFSAHKQRLRQSMKIARLELDYEKELRATETEISEQVFTRLGRDLHDNVGQLLTLMRLQIENNKLDDPGMAVALEPVENTLTTTSEQVRLISRSLNSDYINQRGLVASVETEVERLRQLKKPSVHYEHNENNTADMGLDKNRQLIVFRIFQEMLNNSLKHSGATNLTIKMDASARFLLEVQDDGKGFDLQQLQQSGDRSGLTNMEKRAKMIGLDLDIDSAPGKGCRYTLKAL